jgi:cytochrome c2
MFTMMQKKYGDKCAKEKCSRCHKVETEDTGYGLEPLMNGKKICRKCFRKQINS